MASNGTKKVAVDLDLSTGAKIKNLTAASATGEAVEFSQLNTSLLAKQDTVSGGPGISLDGASIQVDLTEGGTDYSTVTVSGQNAPVNGVYARLPNRGHFDNAGVSIDYFHNTGDYAMYWKDNGGGVYYMLGMRDTDGDYSDGSGSWYSFPVSVNPSTLNANVSNIVPDYTVTQYNLVSLSEGQDENGARIPDPADSAVTYPTGSGASYLKFSSDELQCDVITDMADAATGKLADSNTIKTYIDEQDVISRAASSNTFVNTIAGLTGNPSNVQSAVEAAASEIDTIDSQVITLQNTDTTHTNQIASHSSVLGVANLDNDFGSWSAPGVAFIGAGNLTAKPAIQELGDSIAGVYTNLGTMLGLGFQETDFGTGFVILSNNASAKTLFQEIEVELQNLSQGVGQFWAPVDGRVIVNVNLSNPGTDTFDGYTASIGDRILVKGQTVASENGIYEFNGSSSAMTRATDADLSAEFSQNKTVQVLNSGTEGISGSVWAYTGSDDPVIDTDSLSFELKSQGVVGDGSVTEGKLAAALLAVLNAKTDKFAEEKVLLADTTSTVNHNLDSTDVIVQFRDSDDNVVDVEVDIVDSSNVTIRSSFAVTGRVVVIG